MPVPGHGRCIINADQEAAPVGRTGNPRDRSVQPVRQPVERDHDQRPTKRADDNRDGPEQADGKSGHRHVVGLDAAFREAARQPIERQIDPTANSMIEHYAICLRIS